MNPLAAIPHKHWTMPLYFTMIIEPPSSLAIQLEERLGGMKYYIFNNKGVWQ
jgi:hypothetical protein